jgi:hypothetical protein
VTVPTLGELAVLIARAEERDSALVTELSRLRAELERIERRLFALVLAGAVGGGLTAGAGSAVADEVVRYLGGG